MPSPHPHPTGELDWGGLLGCGGGTLTDGTLCKAPRVRAGA